MFDKSFVNYPVLLINAITRPDLEPRERSKEFLLILSENKTLINLKFNVEDTYSNQNIAHFILSHNYPYLFFYLIDWLKTQNALLKRLLLETDDFNQNSLHYATQLNDDTIFKTIVLLLQESAPSGLSTQNIFYATPIDLAQRNPVFKSIDFSVLKNKTKFLKLLPNIYGPAPLFGADLKRLVCVTTELEQLDRQHFTGILEINLLHHAARYSPLSEIRELITLVGRKHAKRMAKQVDRFGRIPLQLVRFNTHEPHELIYLEIEELTVNNNKDKKPLKDKIQKSIASFYDIFKPYLSMNETKEKFIEEIYQIAERTPLYSQMDDLIDQSSILNHLTQHRSLIKKLSPAQQQ